MVQPDFQLSLQPRTEREQPVEFGLGERAEIEKVALHLDDGAVLNARSIMSSPLSASSRARLSGGNSRTTLPAGPLASRNSFQHPSPIRPVPALRPSPLSIP